MAEFTSLNQFPKIYLLFPLRLRNFPSLDESGDERAGGEISGAARQYLGQYSRTTLCLESKPCKGFIDADSKKGKQGNLSVMRESPAEVWEGCQLKPLWLSLVSKNCFPCFSPSSMSR